MSHIHTFKHISKKKQINFFDRVMMVAGVIYPLTSIPQIIEVFSGNTAGVSILSWGGFMFFTVLFTAYGYVHKIRLIYVTNLLWLIMQGAVITGSLLNS